MLGACTLPRGYRNISKMLAELICLFEKLHVVQLVWDVDIHVESRSGKGY